MVESDFQTEEVVFCVHVLPEQVGVFVQLLAVDAQYGLIVNPERVSCRVTYNGRSVRSRRIVCVS